MAGGLIKRSKDVLVGGGQNYFHMRVRKFWERDQKSFTSMFVLQVNKPNVAEEETFILGRERERSSCKNRLIMIGRLPCRREKKERNYGGVREGHRG